MEIIKADNLGIKFKTTKRVRTRARDFLISYIKNFSGNQEEFWALRHVSLTVLRGETVGIIGKNGSGKSTLLRVIAGIYPPDEGTFTVNGDISTLFSLGTGFQPELSGKDNIYLNGVIMGLSKSEINRLLNQIIDFADLGVFIDMPVKTYSSGMQSRLGFSIAMHIKKDIVLIDEVMGAGDAAFREKAYAKMEELIGSKTIVLVSHGMNAISKFSNKVIWLEKGRIKSQGDPKEVVDKYLKSSGLNKESIKSEKLDYRLG